MPYLHPDKIVAWVPPGKKHRNYICGMCKGLTVLNMKEMKTHLEKFHGLKVSGGGYAFYRDEEEK